MALIKIEELDVAEKVKEFLFDTHKHCEEIDEPVYKYSDVVKLIQLLQK